MKARHIVICVVTIMLVLAMFASGAHLVIINQITGNNGFVARTLDLFSRVAAVFQRQ